MTYHHGKIVAQRGDLHALNCTNCGFIHLYPQPRSAESVYQSGEYHAQVKPSMQKEYNEDSRWWDMVYGDFLSLISDAPVRHLHDVGAGYGHFVRYARRHGWSATGIEPDARLARENKLYHGSYSNSLMRGFGCISAHWVLEHLPDPHNFMLWARGVIHPLGYLMLTVPNDFSAIQLKAMLKISKPYYFLNEHHVNYFNKKSLSRLLEHHGFEIVRSLGSWTPENYLFDDLDYIGDDSLGRQLHRDRMTIELHQPAWFRRLWQRVNGLMGWGRDLTVIARLK